MKQDVKAGGRDGATEAGLSTGGTATGRTREKRRKGHIRTAESHNITEKERSAQTQALFWGTYYLEV